MSDTDQTEPDIEENAKQHAVKETHQGKQYLEVPHVHMATAGVSDGDTVGIRPMNRDGEFCLELNVDDSVGLSRKFRESRTQRPESLLTIPKRVSTAARLTGDPVTYHSDSDRIIAVLDHDSIITGTIDVFNVSEKMMSPWKSGVYTYKIPTTVYEKVAPDDHVWFSYDVLGDGFLFVLDADAERAPKGALELNIQYVEDAKYPHLVHLPKQICDALEINGATMKWGHDGNQRILGLLH